MTYTVHVTFLHCQQVPPEVLSEPRGLLTDFRTVTLEDDQPLKLEELY
jgi:hypothetical protein